ncbi:conserved hypothetical protein [Ricinus communis]|uniref:Uncharacterized protein n=1 Tax=Ricinus communis TaxID=3988 RepID=B9SHW5_RICCO|nr:conserved hypothetical protein [Ricinus communis]
MKDGDIVPMRLLEIKIKVDNFIINGTRKVIGREGFARGGDKILLMPQKVTKDSTRFHEQKSVEEDRFNGGEDVNLTKRLRENYDHLDYRQLEHDKDAQQEHDQDKNTQDHD